MTDTGPIDPLDAWAVELQADVVAPLSTEQIAGVARAAGAATLAGSAGAAAATGAVVATHATTKVIAAVVLATTLAGAVGAVTGSLPDPVQSWVADVVDHVGIHLPRPQVGLPYVDVTVPDIDVPAPTVPDLPTLTVPGSSSLLTVPSVPGLDG